MNYDKYLVFKITQSSSAQVFFNIKKELGFGSLPKQKKLIILIIVKEGVNIDN